MGLTQSLKLASIADDVSITLLANRYAIATTGIDDFSPPAVLFSHVRSQANRSAIELNIPPSTFS
ncbi:hypothetical protein D3C84_484620 [compost metagenome]